MASFYKNNWLFEMCNLFNYFSRKDFLFYVFITVLGFTADLDDML